MGKFLNSCWWVRDLSLFESLAGEALHHLNCQHTGKFEQNCFKKVKCLVGGGGSMGGFGVDCYIRLNMPWTCKTRCKER